MRENASLEAQIAELRHELAKVSKKVSPSAGVPAPVREDIEPGHVFRTESGYTLVYEPDFAVSADPRGPNRGKHVSRDDTPYLVKDSNGRVVANCVTQEWGEQVFERLVSRA